MSHTLKGLSERDANQTLKSSYNDIDASLTSTGFLTGLVGRKMVFTISTTTVSNDTVSIAFSENGTALYTYKLIYTDSTQATIISAERTA